MAADSWLDDETSLDKFLALLLLLLLALAAAVVGSRFLDCGVTGLRSLEAEGGLLRHRRRRA